MDCNPCYPAGSVVDGGPGAGQQLPLVPGQAGVQAVYQAHHQGQHQVIPTTQLIEIFDIWFLLDPLQWAGLLENMPWNPLWYYVIFPSEKSRVLYIAKLTTAHRLFFVYFTVPEQTDRQTKFLHMLFMYSHHSVYVCFTVYTIYFGGLECVGHSFAYVAHFMIFEGCLDSNSESCRSRRAPYLPIPLTFPPICIYDIRTV
jgi:hypothetical protein